MAATSKKKLTHIDPRGDARMVDVSTKPVQERHAIAEAAIQLSRQTISLIESNRVVKGNVLATARIAGIMAAKKTGELIPLCHPLAITHCEINFVLPRRRNEILIRSSVRITGQTGVEMEALTAVSVAALTIYDMCKAVDKNMIIGPVRLISKVKTELAQISKPSRLSNEN